MSRRDTHQLERSKGTTPIMVEGPALNMVEGWNWPELHRDTFLC